MKTVDGNYVFNCGAVRSSLLIARENACSVEAWFVLPGIISEKAEMSDEPASPTVADLPKMPADLAAGVTSSRELKPCETQEKNPLPTKEGVHCWV